MAKTTGRHEEKMSAKWFIAILIDDSMSSITTVSKYAGAIYERWTREKVVRASDKSEGISARGRPGDTTHRGERDEREKKDDAITFS